VLIIKLISAIYIQIDINFKATLNNYGKYDNKNGVSRIIER
jgi:hypothetical protein